MRTCTPIPSYTPGPGPRGHPQPYPLILDQRWPTPRISSASSKSSSAGFQNQQRRFPKSADDNSQIIRRQFQNQQTTIPKSADDNSKTSRRQFQTEQWTPESSESFHHFFSFLSCCDSGWSGMWISVVVYAHLSVLGFWTASL